MEYYIDTDPGFGSATDIPVTAASVVNPTVTVNTSSLPVGFHNLVIRAQDENNDWSIAEIRSFYIASTSVTSQDPVNVAEYFIDTDPGVGNGIPIPITAGNSIDETITLNTSGLSAGMHVAYIRTRDANSGWSITNSRFFYVGAFGQQQVDGLEYFIDTDPGIGAGGQIDVNPAQDTIDRFVTIPTSGLTSGSYLLGLRAFDASPQYGMTNYYSFTVCDGANADISADQVCVGSITTFTDNSTGVLGGDLFSWDFDADGLEDSNTPGNQTFTYSAAGTYTATLSIDRSGCITTSTITVEVADYPVVNAGIDQAVCDNNASLSATALPNENGVWNIVNGTPSISDNTSASSSITLSNGINELEWLLTDSTGTCSLADTVIFDLRVVSIANAGVDQSVCSDTVTLNANSAGSNEVGTWVLLSGSGTISNSTDPNSLVTGLSATTSFIWEIEDQLANCVSRDTVNVGSNQPINAINQSVSVGIGDSSILLSSSLVSANAGDVLTTTITAQGAKGMATALINGDVQYKPSTGFLGVDSFDFEVCNQCGSCSTGTITIDIPNLAPQVQVDPAVLVIDNTNPQLTVDLSQYASDPNNNIDVASLRVVVQPESGAIATIDNGVLTLDYTGITFNGTDRFSVEICDTSGACVTQEISFSVNVVAASDPPEPGSIIVYNAVSPNGDGKHDFFNIAGITDFPGNIVTIYNKNGSLVYDAQDYNNGNTAFVGLDSSGNELPNGTYYYHITYGESVSTGYLVLTK